jgi:hypothetical protein
MPLAREIMQGGQSPIGARAMNGQVKTNISAAGTTIADATDLLNSINVLSTVASGAGVQLPTMDIQDTCEVYNGGANQCVVYPESSTVAINQLPVGTGMILATNTGCKFTKVSSTAVVGFLSA